MSKLLIHFPVILSLLATASLVWCAIGLSFWIFIPAWQTFCITAMLILDGKSRVDRYRRILNLLKKGYALESLPKEPTVCGFFIRRAAVVSLEPA